MLDKCNLDYASMEYLLGWGINEDRNIDAGCMVDKIIDELKDIGFSVYEARIFFDYAKERIEKSLLRQPMKPKETSEKINITIEVDKNIDPKALAEMLKIELQRMA